MINRALCFVLVFLWCSSSFAAAPVPHYSFGAISNTNPGSVCGALGGPNGFPPEWTGSVDPFTPPAAPRCVYRQDGVYKWAASLGVAMKCSNGSAPNTAAPLEDQCPDSPDPEPDTCSDKNPFVRKFSFPPGAATPAAFGGCVIRIVKVLDCRTEVVNSAIGKYCMIEIQRTGATGDNPPNQAPSSSDPENKNDPKVESPPLTPDSGPCPAGTSQVGSSASGKPICVGGGTSPDAPGTTKPPTTTWPAQTVTNPDGSTTSTQVTTRLNADGSVTTTTTTTNTAVDGSKTVSQTGSTSANSAGGEGNPEDPEQQNFCKQNPMLNVCKNSNVNGTCGDVTCNGDAIQCATLRATAAMQCAQDKDREDMEASDTTQHGRALVDGNDPMSFEIGEAIKGDEIDFSSAGALDSSSFLPSACLSTKTFSVMGRSVVVHFASVCDSIQPLRYVIMAIALIASYMIVAGSILKG